jgi:hypothetical protein
MYFRPKGNKCQLGHLEMLHSKGYTNNRHAQNQPKDSVEDAQLNAADQYPNDVANCTHQAKMARRNIPPKWPEQKSCNLETLYAKWQTDDGNAKHQTDNAP